MRHDEELSVAEFLEFPELNPSHPLPSRPLSHSLRHPPSDHQSSPGLQSHAAKESSLLDLPPFSLPPPPCLSSPAFDTQSRHHKRGEKGGKGPAWQRKRGLQQRRVDNRLAFSECVPPRAFVERTEPPQTFEVRNQVTSRIVNVQRADPSSALPDNLVASITCGGRGIWRCGTRYLVFY